MADLKEDPSLAPKFVEELCRYHTASANALRRVAKVDIELGGKTVRAGDGITCSNMSANRDAEIFPDPDKFDMHQKRGPEKALGFGYGPHECVAEWLARAELETVFATLFQRLPSLRLAIPFEEVEYSQPNMDVGITKLPVVW